MESEYFLVNQKIHDFEEFRCTARDWDLSIDQIEKGRCKTNIQQFVTNKLQVGFSSFFPGTLQKGGAPRGLRTFALLADKSVQPTWRHNTISRNDLMIFPRSADLEAFYLGGALKVFTLSFAESLIDSTCQSQQWEDIETLIGGVDVMRVNPIAMEHLRLLLNELFLNLENPNIDIESASFQNDLHFRLPNSILSVISNSTGDKSTASNRRRDIALSHVIDYLHAYPNVPHTVEDLVRVGQVSERTLQYAFKERFGISPKAYTVAQRLNGVNRELYKACPESDRVTEIASNWGFWHMSQFANDYRVFFEELPSTTLKRQP